MKIFKKLAEKLLQAVINLIISLIIIVGYDLYDDLRWAKVEAMVTSIAPVCIYAKGDGRPADRKRLSCDSAEAATLPAKGYAPLSNKEAIVRATHESQTGQRLEFTLNSPWSLVASLRPGSVISVHYPPGSPEDAKLDSKTGRVAFAVLVFLLLCLAACVALAMRIAPNKRTFGQTRLQSLSVRGQKGSPLW